MSGEPWWISNRGKPDVFFYGRTPLVGLGILIIEVSRTHSHRYTIIGRIPLEE
jgi:hypothetical protein